MRWLRLNLCSATADLSGFPSHIYEWCSFIVFPIYRPVCPMYTWPHWQGMLYTPVVLSPRWSFTRWRRLEIFLGSRLTCLMLCFTNILLSQMYGSRGTELGFSFSLEVLTTGLRGCHICLILYSFSLKVVLRNTNSSWRGLCVTRLKEQLVCWRAEGMI